MVMVDLSACKLIALLYFFGDGGGHETRPLAVKGADGYAPRQQLLVQVEGEHGDEHDGEAV